MSETAGPVGVNGEADDFAARYDRLVQGAMLGWVVKTTLGGVVCLVIVGLLSRLILG